MSQPIMTPCAGKCSTAFGDTVCRGCRRYNHEVDQWNTLNFEQAQLVWDRLDQQLDQLALPLIPLNTNYGVQDAKDFLRSKHMRLPKNASHGRIIYEVLRMVQRNPDVLQESGLALKPEDIQTLWYTIDGQLYQYAVLHYEREWQRAAAFGKEGHRVNVN